MGYNSITDIMGLSSFV